jgi:hypothetical protein
MTILFKQKDFSCEDSIVMSFSNLKEKLDDLKEKEK